MNEPSPDPFAAQRVRDDQLAALLKASAGGDAQAFESYFGATVQDALELACRLTGEHLEDVLTSSYLQAWRDAGKFDPARGSALNWLLAIVRSMAPAATNDSEFSK